MKKLNYPNRVTVELTNRCNVACTFCPRNSHKMKMGDMSEELYKKIIDEMSEHLPIKMVPFFRGESILHPKFVEFMLYAKQKGIGPIQLFSNGLIFNKEIAEAVCEAGVDFVSFSLDTLDPKIYKESRLLGDLDKSTQNVIEFAKLCRIRKKQGLFAPQIQVSSVDLDVYKPYQKEFIEFWKKHVDIVRIYEEHDENGGFVKEETREQLNYLSKRKPCHKLYNEIVIYWDGTVSLCCYDWNEQHEMGNIKRQTIQEVWDSELYEKIRNMNENDTITHDWVCYDCEHWKAGYIENKYLGQMYLGE